MKKTQILILIFFSLWACNLQAQNSKGEPMGVNTESNFAEKEKLKEKAEEKVAEFMARIHNLIEKQSIDVSLEAATAIANNTAQDIFADPINNRIEVYTGKIKSHTISEYLLTLHKYLYISKSYKSIELTFSNIDIDVFKKTPDGKMTGTAVFIQKFVGKTSENKIETSESTKRIQLEAKEVIKNFGGEKITYWEVRLGNITIEQLKNK